jgi:P4 family phage/plasmid primase-like protien
MLPKLGMYIGDDDEAKLHKKIIAANKENRHKSRKGLKVQYHCVVERPKVGPSAVSFFRIEIDLKQPKWLNRRTYLSTTVEDLGKIIWEVLDQYISVKRRHKQLFLLEKSNPTLKRGDPTKDKADKWSDGFKFMAPYVHIKNNLFYLALNEIRELARERKIFSSLVIENTFEEVFDIGVVEYSGWTMYGGCKPDGLPYNVTRVYGYDMVPIDATYPPDELVSLLSIRRSKRRDCAELCEDIDNGIIDERLAKYDAKKSIAKKMDLKNKSLGRMVEIAAEQDDAVAADLNASAGITQAQKHDIESAQKLVAMMTVARSSNYTDWMRVGWALHKIHYTLLSTWIEFSKRATNFKKGECEQQWKKMYYDGFGLAALRSWAAKDNPKKFKAYRTSQIHQALYKGLNGTSFNMANVLKDFLGATYVSASAKQDDWFVFNDKTGHYEQDDGRTLSTKLSEDLVNEYLALASFYQEQAIGKTGMEKDQLIGNATNVHKIVTKLCTKKYKDEVIGEARVTFYIKNFRSNLDTNQNYLGMDDGVYDLQAHTMRDGVPEDMVSMSTNHKFIPYDENNENIQWVYNFMKQLQPNPRIREYLWMAFASCLDGFNREEKFHILTGKGCFDGNTEVLLANGARCKVRSLKMNDELMGWDSLPRTITQIFHNHGKMYRINTEGRSLRVSEEHNLILYLDDIRTETKISTGKTTAFWVEKIGDSVKNCQEVINGGDDAIAKKFRELKKNDAVINGSQITVPAKVFASWPLNIRELCRVIHFNLDGSELGENLKDIDIEKMGYTIGQEIQTDDEQLHIPRRYITNSDKVRRDLFTKICEHSTCNESGEMTFRSEEVAKDVQMLARSIGLGAFIEMRHNRYYIEIRKHWDGLEKLTIVEDGEGPYYGFELSIKYLDENGKIALDGDSEDSSKFFLADMMVASNSNGKSKLISLIQQALGDYATSVDPNLFTKKTQNAEGASPEKARLKGKRAVFSSECEDDDKFAMSIVKSMTGNDVMTARGLFKESIQFHFTAKIFFAVNKLPYVKSTDDASWRRLRAVGFGSRFCENPKKKNEFPIDMELQGKIPENAPYMLCILIHKFKKYKKMGTLKDLPEIMQSTKSYRNDNDCMGEFTSENLERKKGAKDTLINLYGQFVKWLFVSCPSAPKPTKKEFQTYLEEEMKVIVKGGTCHGVTVKDEGDLGTDID